MVSQNTLKASLNFMVIEIYPDPGRLNYFVAFAFSQLREAAKKARENPSARYVRRQTEGC
jgi:hypothetical protein